VKRSTWLLLLLACLVTLAIVAVPVVLIRPFSPQSTAGVAWSYGLRRVSPWVSGGAAVLFVAALVTGWRRARWFGRVGLIVMTLVVLPIAWFARQNHFEWMFRPAPDARFVPAQKAGDVKPEDSVIAVAIGNDSLAFPITRIGYHHVVNTTLGREPIVATY
jgi:uncharacterized membrane protein